MTARAVGVIVYKVVGNRYMEKRVNLRVEHVKHSKWFVSFSRILSSSPHSSNPRPAPSRPRATQLTPPFPTQPR